MWANFWAWAKPPRGGLMNGGPFGAISWAIWWSEPDQTAPKSLGDSGTGLELSPSVARVRIVVILVSRVTGLYLGGYT